ncbi:MAG: hypothetical protein K2X87_21255 [Gemmataceae bacterium]|nr:hypothetical protein [Gemmataceae bacterium]
MRGRPRKTAPPATDNQALVAEVVQEVLSVLREHGIAVPLPTMAAVITAAERLVPAGDPPEPSLLNGN